MPGGALDLIDGRRAGRACSAIYALHCDPSRDVGTVGLRTGADHVRRRRGDRPADRPRRAHLAPAPDRGPDLRARQGGHRGPGRAVAGASTRGPGATLVWG